MTLNQAVEKMRGPVNTKIRLRIMRKGADKPIEVAITRDIIRVRSVRYRIEGGDVGYIRITQFNEQTTEGLKKALSEIAAQIPPDKLRGYIIDLRNNPGGLLDQAISVSDTFLDRGEIVSTRGRDPEETQRFNARPGDLTKGKPIIVLINGGSASASEIVAGALQDHKRATVVGTRSFGKGSVQTIIPLGRGNGALRLTTARYYTPAGRSIQAKGIVPDIESLQEVPEEVKAARPRCAACRLPGEGSLERRVRLPPLSGGGAQTDMKRFDLMHQINARGTFMVSKDAIAHLERSQNPHILMLSPPLDMAEKWFAPYTGYTMAKFGMSMVVLGLAGELRPEGHRRQRTVAPDDDRDRRDQEPARGRRDHAQVAHAGDTRGRRL